MEYKFKQGDMLVPIEGDADANDVYTVVSTGRNMPTDVFEKSPTSPNFSEGFDIYRVKVPNSKSGHDNVLDKGAKYIHKQYRKATTTEEVLFGKKD